MDNDLQARMAYMKRTIRDLKTARDLRSNMRTFHLAITLPTYESYTTHRIRAVYAAGTQPIMTTVTGDRHIIPLESNGNTQDFVLAVRRGNYQFGQNVYFLSTRRIVSLTIA